MTQRPRRSGPAVRHLAHPTRPGSSSPNHSSSHPQSFSSSSFSSLSSCASFSFSISSLCRVVLLLLAFLQAQPVANAKAVVKLTDNSRGGVASVLPLKSSPFSFPCDDEGGDVDPLRQEAVAIDLKTQMSSHLGLENSQPVSPEAASLLNGTHTQGRLVRQRLRALVRSNVLREGQRETDVDRLRRVQLLPAEGTHTEKYVFHSVERAMNFPVQMTKSEVPTSAQLHVFTFNTWLRLPQKIYHDLIIKSAILRMRISQSKVDLYRKLSALGMRLTANIFLLEDTSDAGNNTFPRERATLIKSSRLSLSSDTFMTAEINASLLTDLVDSEDRKIAIGLTVNAERPQGSSENVTPSTDDLNESKNLKFSRRKSNKALPALTSLPISSTVSSSMKSSSSLSVSSLSPSSTKALSSSSFSFPSQTVSDQLTVSSQSPSSAGNPTDPDNRRFSVQVSEASLQVEVITEDLRDSLDVYSSGEVSSRTRRSAFRNRGCRGGLCCLKSVRVSLEGELIWNRRQKYILFSTERVNYCSGRCKPAYNTVSNLGDLLSKLHGLFPNRVPAPSCTPDRLGSLELWVLDSDGYPMPREFPNMRVESCKCL